MQDCPVVFALIIVKYLTEVVILVRRHSATYGQPSYHLMFGGVIVTILLIVNHDMPLFSLNHIILMMLLVFILIVIIPHDSIVEHTRVELHHGLLMLLAQWWLVIVLAELAIVLHHVLVDLKQEVWIWSEFHAFLKLFLH